ncbi:hypothetical protein CLOM_g5197 [Closterium sp. NIES-68]|nr:hypothetical protein CLOM_g5197 [Closterium sp. NIES-68]GJP69685.1 hypothetical protein CLOP_g672 [Closterium sp. NIES-67]
MSPNSNSHVAASEKDRLIEGMRQNRDDMHEVQTTITHVQTMTTTTCNEGGLDTKAATAYVMEQQPSPKSTASYAEENSQQ